MKKMMILMLTGLVLGSIASFMSTNCVAAEAAKPITLKFSSPLAESSWFGQNHKWFCDELEKRTDGRIKIQIFWMQSLSKHKDALPALQSGFVDMAHTSAISHPSSFPLFMILESMCNSREDYAAAILACIETATNEPNLKAEFEKLKVVPIIPWHSGALHLGFKKCIGSLKDLKGMSIRPVGGVRAEYLKLLGANPVDIPPIDLYEAIDRGTIQGLEISYGLAFALKLYEPLKCVYLNNSGASVGSFILMNSDVFKRLPRDVQEIIPKLRSEYAVRLGQGLMDYDAEMAREWETKHGLTRKYPTPEEQKLLLETGQKANETLVKQQESGGHTAAGKVLNFYMNALKKYEDERAKKK
jgi:TRAP-type transport system periplasmic protein